MTISAFILEPQNDFERSFFIPIATEAFFKRCWLPAIQSLNLQWTAIFSTGINVEKEDVPSICGELHQIQKWAAQHLEQEEHTKLSERITRLLQELPQAFQRENAVVFIG
ncbi:hypothetical protein [Paenibacillus sp. Leaf72]|uniref:hypothetical protein n=1 Tax=Paenibacillus sp. Leaf72 TaxID=1736234 RepID=UPI0006FA374B|nr:hypothetical protein [Paenibacillus sp. Leaf72]KQO13750.1 hypothetical protein ASF12_29860 [Paenibacillus sp. Leaf72]